MLRLKLNHVSKRGHSKYVLLLRLKMNMDYQFISVEDNLFQVF